MVRARCPPAVSGVSVVRSRAVAVVGAGPRGTSVVERICASAPELLGPGQRLTVHVIDPDPPGPGRTWRTAQSPELLMNTVASQVTLFTDETVETEGPIRPGPSLHEWCRSHPGHRPGPDDYPPRALYGAYLEWFFAETARRAPERVTIRTHRSRAVRLSGGDDGPQRLDLADGTRLTGLTAVVLAQGHLPADPDAAERRLAEHAAAHGLAYLPPANPADVADELAALPAGRPVLLRGLGLNFFDHMALLTSGRGGRFVRRTASGTKGGREGGRDGLRYVPSGREPLLYAGSRRGVPYHARGDNAKGAHGRHLPLLLTPAVIGRFRERTAAGDRPDFRAEVWPLVAKEVETVYYEALLARRAPSRPGAPSAAGPGSAFRARFLAAAHGSAAEAAVLAGFGLDGPGERWDWPALSAPHRDRAFASPAEHRAWLLERLRDDIAAARLGNVEGPVKAALDVLRDLRNELRQIVDDSGLTGRSHREDLDRWYTPLNAFLSIGPPRRRIEEMAALVEAGVLDVLGPRLRVRPCDGGFAAHSPAVPGRTVTAPALIEARLPGTDLRRTADPLLRGLLEAGECRAHTVDGYPTGGLDVAPRPYRLRDGAGRPHPRRFAVGVPTEGVHWVTAAGARPGVGSVMLTDTDAVARAVLRTLSPPAASAPSVREAPATAPLSAVPPPRAPASAVPQSAPRNGTETQARRSPA
ncbi:FAD/NAD(P)-binding protein [Streptomyces boncukensis]|uniref:FAD/NAD(P)-binding protein n=1 Tax=Streptomyces boncukensis TaxID=2711219 RepID=A0A6G4WZ24_9ACTN|nr:FAD/NAD(P)-binding protein [Streptomyces boncukensis]NGO70253.1 FAD/NAD(P)-binding protein [Streptomyces boncukensis]